jgi:hypothetical protein
MASTYNHENYYGEEPPQPSKLKRLARSFGRAASKALLRFNGTSNNLLDSETANQSLNETEVEPRTGRAIKLPVNYNPENNRKTQPAYYGRIYDRKGESVVPLDLLWKYDMLIAIYNMTGNTDRRYLVVQKVPELHTGGSNPEEKVKFSEVYMKLLMKKKSSPVKVEILIFPIRSLCVR